MRVHSRALGTRSILFRLKKSAVGLLPFEKAATFAR
jgi:hypothetical protein